VLDKYGVGFRVNHGFASATAVNDVATIYDDARPLTALYVGDWDPSGLHMSEVDLPERLAKYGGVHVQVKRIALMQEQLPRCRPFPRGISAKTRATNGSSMTTAIAAGKLTRSIRTNFETVSRHPSRLAFSISIHGNAANRSAKRRATHYDMC
jgi:hypothetical protein